MATVSVSASLPTEPVKTWDALSDLPHWEDWLTIHEGWRSELPSEVAPGARITEVVSVMGMTNKIEWTVDQVDAPHRVAISGIGMANVSIEFVLSVAADGDGSTATIDATFTGAMVLGPIGKAVAKNAKADLEKSLAKFAELHG